MDDLKRTARMALALAVLSLISLGLSVSALADIAGGEQDLTMEWSVLRVAAFVFLVFIALTFVTLVRVLKLPS